MRQGAAFPTGQRVVRPSIRNEGGLKHLPGTSELMTMRDVLDFEWAARHPTVLVLSVRDLVSETDIRSLSEAMYWCLRHDSRLVILAVAPFDTWCRMHIRLSDRQPRHTVWALPSPELAQILGVAREEQADQPSGLRNGWCVIKLTLGTDDYVVHRHWAAAGDEAHDFTALG